MKILGLTGSIGMGKSSTVAMLARFGLPVDDADATVHRLLADDRQLIEQIGAAFPGTVVAGVVDRQRLADIVFSATGDASPRRRLERLIHPRVAAARRRFVDRHRRAGASLVVLDIPLLFEVGADAAVDIVIVVTAPAFLQRQRVLSRPGMTQARFDAILAAQLPDQEKRRRADYLVFTGLDKHYTLRCLRWIVRSIQSHDGPKASPPSRQRHGSYARSRPRY